MGRAGSTAGVSVGGLLAGLARSVRLLVGGWRVGLGIPLLVQAPWLLLQRILDVGLSELGPAPSGGDAVLIGTGAIDLVLIAPFFTAAITAATLRWARGMTALPGDALAGGRRHLVRTSGAIVLAALAAGAAGAVALAVPGLPMPARVIPSAAWAAFVLARFAYAAPLVVRERVGPVTALRTSWGMTAGTAIGMPAIVLAVSLAAALGLHTSIGWVRPMIASEVLRAAGTALVHAAAVVWLTVSYLQRVDRGSVPTGG